MQEPNLKDVAYEHIKKRILNCALMPGSNVNEEIIQRETGISRTPIREAIQMLQAERFLTIYPRRGIFVTQLTIGFVRNLYEARMLIEPEIIARTPMDKAVLQSFYDESIALLADSGTDDELRDRRFASDEKIHKYFYTATNNPYLQNIMKNITEHVYRIQILTYDAVHYNKDSDEEHRDIIGALLNDDRELAKKHLMRHIQLGEDGAMLHLRV